MKIKWNKIKDILEKIGIAAGIIVWAGVYLWVIYLFTINVLPNATEAIAFFFMWSIIWGFIAMPFCTHLEGKKKIPSRSF